MNILISCEESQTVCKAFREKGHFAFSNDIIKCSGGHPEWHIIGDTLRLINGKCRFETENGDHYNLKYHWDMIIAHPPCTYLTVTGNRWYDIERYGYKAIERFKYKEKAIEFFKAIANAQCDKICIENPVGVMSTEYKKPSQIIEPYQFGHPTSKRTCLWLKNLPLLEPTEIVDVEYHKGGNARHRMSEWFYQTGLISNQKERAKARSKTFQGIAKAMSEQWG